MATTPFITDRTACDDALGLIAQFGDDAGFEAAARADYSRDLGNVRNFCRWRQIERLIVHLTAESERVTRH